MPDNTPAPSQRRTLPAGTESSTCPLCGRGNQCGLVEGGGQTTCWCFGLKIEREVLTRIAVEQIDRTCLCPSCARNLPPATPGTD